ncbi:MAG TPA: PQQ-dependent sugar dehydrogenase [Nitrospira sp.]|nr:PQQ-dependent sugar dehydrogenase [Nitrospira sp.]
MCTTHTVLLISLLMLSCAGCGGGGSDQPPQAPSAPPSSTSLTFQPVAQGLTGALYLTAPPGDASRVLVVEQGGTIRLVDLPSGAVRTLPFLDITALVTSGGERGLLGLAFDPDYAANGRFYVYYTNVNGDIVIARYVRDASNGDTGDPASAVPLLTVPHPTFANHNGGMLAFGHDGCLYAGVGDGGSEGDPNNRAQDRSQLLGKILRLDPETGQPCANGITNPFGGANERPEIWSLGLRNPFRFSFDRVTDDLYIGDVGQDTREEVDVARAPNAGRGLNFGWRLMEGFACFNPASNCDPGGLTPPVLDYPHVGGACTVIGGYVYRGAIASLRGTYFYGDFCAGFVRSFRLVNGQPTEQTEWPLLNAGQFDLTSFGEDAQGELYVTTQSGTVFKIVTN